MDCRFEFHLLVLLKKGVFVLLLLVEPVEVVKNPLDATEFVGKDV